MSDFKKFKDEELMELYIANNEAAFNELYIRYSSKIFGYFKYKGCSNETSSDLIQDFFNDFHRGRSTYKKGFKLAPWIFTIAHNCLLRYAKRNNYKKEELSENYSADLEEETHFDMDELWSAINKLPEAQKDVLKMRFFEDKEYSEISKKLSKTEVNVRKILSRAVSKLKQRFRDEKI